ncbi:hypothetical protein EVAR_23294_1 [Eumeta japonica]|uniref:Uncharacterized protein n=1 Tax=Eumeta variegata TaxID=151549 RepID=A0A4C1V6Q9_EUMVA|nr:hypothetical protein EVAR_23294_1 [Eumeta japonica]
MDPRNLESVTESVATEIGVSYRNSHSPNEINGGSCHSTSVRIWYLSVEPDPISFFSQVDHGTAPPLQALTKQFLPSDDTDAPKKPNSPKCNTVMHVGLSQGSRRLDTLDLSCHGERPRGTVSPLCGRKPWRRFVVALEHKTR